MVEMAEINVIDIGIALILIGFLIIIIGSLTSKDAKIGIGGFIGPFAFGWANDPKLLPWIIALTIVMAVIFLILLTKGIRS